MPESEHLQAILDGQRHAAWIHGPPQAEERIDRIDRLIEVVAGNADALANALTADFGQRGAVTSYGSDVAASVRALRYSRKRVRRWMEDRPVPGSRLLGLGGIKAHIRYQPLGAVGILSPWNFPVALSLHPLGQAFAAGNRAMLKVSEVTGSTSAVLARVLSDAFDPDELAIVEGGSEVAAAFCQLPFDHIFFTGSTATGRRVMEAAAPNLVPVTLELGGQSPVVVAEDADLATVAAAMVFGKTFNAGQYCVAPDHLYLPSRSETAFVSAVSAAAATMFPNGLGEESTAIVDDRQFQRLRAHLDDARSKGARVVPVMEATSLRGVRMMPPTLVLDVDDSMTICQEEIFGPILPVHRYDTIDEVIDRINSRPRPLAAYYFGRDSAGRRRFADRTVSGGLTFNDIALHVGIESLPFGGVGSSGMGTYHGRAGFETFSHAKVVVDGPSRPFTRFVHPPYPTPTVRALRWHARHTEASVRRRRRRP